MQPPQTPPNATNNPLIHFIRNDPRHPPIEHELYSLFHPPTSGHELSFRVRRSGLGGGCRGEESGEGEEEGEEGEGEDGMG